jgi:hypothetical protein
MDVRARGVRGLNKSRAAIGGRTSMEEQQMTNKIREQFVRDMQVAGLAAKTQETYLYGADSFFRTSWIAAEAATETDVQNYLVSLRERDVAKGTFRVQRYALEFLFVNTLRREWPLFKKKLPRRPRSVYRRCCRMSSA